MESEFLSEHSTAYKLMLEELDLTVGSLANMRSTSTAWIARMHKLDSSMTLTGEVHSKRVKKMNYTRNEWRRWTTLETSEEDELHLKRVKKMNYTRNEWRRWTTPQTSKEDEVHSKRVKKMNYTRNEWRRMNYTRNDWRTQVLLRFPLARAGRRSGIRL